MRKRIFEIIEYEEGDDPISMAYDVGMMVVIIVSLVPLAFKESRPVFTIINIISAVIFIIDYVLRLITADYKLKDGARSFVKYPFTFMAIIDLISILPALMVINGTFGVVRILRLARTFRIFRVFKMLRYSRNTRIIKNVFLKEKELLSIVVWIAVVYVLVAALVILNVEPESFENYFEAVYWAVVSLTTMGYGDIYPVTAAGRLVTVVSAFAGVAIVALPSAIITGGLIDELKNGDDTEKEDDDKS